MFICKSYIIGGEIVEQMILFETLAEAVKWANKKARIEWVVYHVAIYELNTGIPFVDPYSPGKPVKIVKP